MALSTWTLFALISLATAFSPGPSVLLAISNSIASGPRRALFSSAGNAVGVFVVSGAAITGLGLLLQASALAFAALKLLGAGYLIYLGIRQWRSDKNIFKQSAEATTGADAGASRLKLFLHGLLVSTTNPKSILFFTALFPQFMSPETGHAGLFLLLTGTFSACTIVSHLSYVYLAGTMKSWFSTPGRARHFNRVSGLTFIGLGVGMLKLRPSAT